MPIRGELAVPRYIRHPAASTSNPLSNGWAVDAGTSVLLDNNLHKLEEEATRPLVMSLGPGKIPSFQTQDALFADVAGITPVDTTTLGFAAAESWRKIPWDRRTAVPFPAIFVVDYDLATGEASIRPVRIYMQATIDLDAEGYDAHAAITFTEDSPYGQQTPPYLYGTASFGGVGKRTAEIALTPTTPVTRRGTSGTLRCRTSGAGDLSTTIDVVNGYVWVGFSIWGAGVTASYIDSISVWEVWE